MAGGPHAAVVPCMICFARAERVYEGVEDDSYRCETGHVFGIDWSYGDPPTQPLWPPTEEARKKWEATAAIRAKF